MKNPIKKLAPIIISFLFILSSQILLSQVPPDPPNGHGSSSNQSPSGGAPIGGGLFILLGLAAAYGGKQLHDIRKEELEE